MDLNATAVSTNHTLPWVPPTCTSQNWSNGSALSVLFALAVGCLAHPPGSLTFNKSNRIWRLSPHFGLLEAINLLFKLVFGLSKGCSLRVVCVTLLALRTGNAWTSRQYDKYRMDWAKAQAGEQPHIEPVGRSATFDAEEGRAAVNLLRRTNRVAAPEGGSEIEMTDWTAERTEDTEQSNSPSNTQNFDAQLLARQVRLAFDSRNEEPILDAMFLTQLEEIQKNEKGITFRLLVWTPMVYSLLKIFSVSGGWSIWGPKACGCMFFCSWFTAEIITIIASRGHLSSQKRNQAAQLSRGWRKTWEREYREAVLYPIINNRPGFSLGRLACIVLLGFNAWPLLVYSAGPYFNLYLRYGIWAIEFMLLDDWSSIKGILMGLIMSISINLFVNAPFYVYALLYPGLIYALASPLALQWLTTWPILLCKLIGVSEKTISYIPCALKLADTDGMVPGYLACGQAVLTVLRYTRVLNDYASYDCSTTTQVSWYDWTG